MNRRVSQYIITSVLAAAIVLPGFFWGQADSPLVLDTKTLLRLVLQGLPLLILLIGISVYGSAEERLSRGWKKARLRDIPAVLILLALTLLLARFFPADSGSYSVRLAGFGGIAFILLFSLITALTEELFFRSWLLSTFTGLGWPYWLAILVSVATFTSLHRWQGWAGLLFSALSGFIYSLWFLKHRRLIPIVTAHTIHNALALWIAAGR